MLEQEKGVNPHKFLKYANTFFKGCELLIFIEGLKHLLGQKYSNEVDTRVLAKRMQRILRSHDQDIPHI